MRSSVPIPGNPWPHDMTIAVEDDSQALLDLLWIREAWNLHPVGDDLPPLLTATPASARAEIEVPSEFAHWQYAWPDLWEACLIHAGLIHDTDVLDQLLGTANGSAERVRLLNQMMGPSWRDTFGDAAFTNAHHAWARAAFYVRVGRHSHPLEEEPERVSLEALISAWHAGLSKVVVIPCRGSHTRVIGEHTLLVASETRDDPQRYSEALAQFH